MHTLLVSAKQLPRWAWFELGCCLAIVTVLHVNYWKLLYSAESHLVGDCGWAALVYQEKELIPCVDYSFYYGLLSLLINEYTRDLFGNSPHIHVTYSIIANFITSINILICIQKVSTNRPVRALAIICIPFALQFPFPSITHCLDHILLSSAIALYTYNNMRLCIVAIILSCFIKPSMGYLAIALLATDHIIYRRESLKTFIIISAAIIAVLTSAIILQYGYSPLVMTQIPILGKKAYQTLDMGFFFGIGRDFWLPKGGNIKYYLGTPSGWFLCSTMLILVTTLTHAIRFRNCIFKTTPATRLRYGLFVVHSTFILFLFGNAWSWGMYSYVIIILLCMSIDEVYSTMPNFIFVPMIAISVLAITGQYSQLKSSWVGFTSMTDKTGTQLYYPSHQQEVWSKLNRHAFPEPLLVISSSGYPEYLGANHTSLKTWCYISTVATRQETDNIIKSMSESHYWAVYQASGSINLVNDNRFTSIVNQMEVIHQDEKFIYYRRR